MGESYLWGLALDKKLCIVLGSRSVFHWSFAQLFGIGHWIGEYFFFPQVVDGQCVLCRLAGLLSRMEWLLMKEGMGLREELEEPYPSV